MKDNKFTKKVRDKEYVIDLCDKVLGMKASRQHRFDFLRGDTGVRLPVDAYYPEKNLVIEYYERQHTEPVKFFNKKQTASGVSRDEQRRIYDKRRLEVLPQNGVDVVVINYSDLQHNESNKRLLRFEPKDISVIQRKLAKYTKRCNDSEYIEDYEDESFADLLAAASYQDSVNDVSGQEEIELHRNVWEFWHIMNNKSYNRQAKVSVSRKAKADKKVDLSSNEKKARTAWRIFYIAMVVFALSWFFSWTIMKFISLASVSIIYTWSIFPNRKAIKRYKFIDFALIFFINIIWIGLMFFAIL